MTTVGLPQSLISTLPGSYYTDPTIFAMEQADDLRVDVVLRRAVRRPRQARRLQDRSGRTGERAAHPVPQR